MYKKHTIWHLLHCCQWSLTMDCDIPQFEKFSLLRKFRRLAELRILKTRNIFDTNISRRLFWYLISHVQRLSRLEETLDSQLLPVIKTSNSAQSSRQPCLYFATLSIGMDSRIPKVLCPQRCVQLRLHRQRSTESDK